MAENLPTEPGKAYKKTAVTPTDLYSLKYNDIGKKWLHVPADTLQKTEDQMIPQVAHWPLYTCIYSNVKRGLGELEQNFMRFVSHAELRKGFLQTEVGRLLASVMDTVPAVGDDLCYKVQEYPRIFQDAIDNNPVHLLAASNTRQFQHVGAFIDYEVFSAVMNHIITTASYAIDDTIRACIYSMLLSNVPKLFMNNGHMELLFGKDLQPTANESSKGTEEYYGTNSKIKAICKKMAGEFQAKLKNVLYYDPRFASLHDPNWGIAIPDATKEAAATDENTAKEKLQTRYIQKTGATKNNPPKGQTRAVSIYALIKMLTHAVTEMTGNLSVRNWMMYDPHATAAPTEPQFMCQAEAQNLIIIMNPADLDDAKQGVSFTGPAGTVLSATLNTGMVKGVYGLHGMLPGEAIIIDYRSINIIPFFNQTYENKNYYYLFDQYFTHYMFKWGMFKYMAGMRIVPTQFVPDIFFMTRFLPKFKA